MHIQDLPALPAPQLSFTPAQPMLGEDIMVSCPELPGVGKVQYGYWWEYDDGQSSYWGSTVFSDGNGAFSIAIDTGYMDRPATLYVEAMYLPTADGGYSRSEWCAPFSVRVEAGEPLAAPQITLKSDEIYTDNGLFVTATAEGLDQIRYKILDEEGNEIQSGGPFEIDEDNYFGVWMYEAGSFTLCVRGRINGRWSDWSEGIPFTVLAKQQFPTPTLNVPNRIAAGADLNDFILLVDKACDFEVDLLKYIEPEEADGEGEWENLDNWWFNSNDYDDWDERQYVGRIPGHWLEDGTTYKISVIAHPYYYDQYDESDWATAQFTVTGEKAAAPTLTVTEEKESWLVNETATFAVDVDYEVVALKVQIDQEEGNSWGFHEEFAADEDFEYELDQQGTWTIRASAKNNGVWSQWSEPITLTVSMVDYLEDPIITHSGALKGEDLVYTIVADERADSVKVEVFRWNEYDGETVLYSEWLTPVDHTATVRIDKSMVTEGGYEISVMASAVGYGRVSDYVYFDIGGRMDLPKGLKAIEDEAFYDVRAQAIVIPDGCVSIGRGAFRHDEIDTLTTVVVPASVTYIDPEAFPETEDYGDDDYYNPVTIITPAGSTADSYARSHHMKVINR